MNKRKIEHSRQKAKLRSLGVKVTLPETNSSPLKIGLPNRKVVFQPSIFGCYVSFREAKLLVSYI